MSRGLVWYDGMFSPTKCSELQMTGAIAGGHEVQVIGWNRDLSKWWIRNSWKIWGLNRAGPMGLESGYAYLRQRARRTVA